MDGTTIRRLMPISFAQLSLRYGRGAASLEDRIVTTVPRSSDLATNRAWHLPLVLLTDRSASFRGPYVDGLNARLLKHGSTC